MMDFRGDSGFSPLSNRCGYTNQPQAPTCEKPRDIVEPQSEQAVQATSDTVEIDPMAQSVANLQSIISRLKQNGLSGEEIVNALKDLKSFVNDNTNASMVGTTLGKLADMADAFLEMATDNPSMLAGNFEFGFEASFSQEQIKTDNFYSNVTAFSFSMSFRNDETLFSASAAYSEKFTTKPGEVKYESKEQVTLKMVTLNTDLETNPALKAFVDITGSLTGTEAAALLGLKKEEAAEPAPRPVVRDHGNQHFFERMRALSGLAEKQLSLIEAMRQWIESGDEEVPEGAAA